jgi:hypothetical protein
MIKNVHRNLNKEGTPPSPPEKLKGKRENLKCKNEART